MPTVHWNRRGAKPRSRSVRLVFADVYLSHFDFRLAYDAAPMDAQRDTGALLIAASIVTAIRLRGEPIKPSPKLTATIAESVQLAGLILRE